MNAPGRPTYLDKNKDFYWGIRNWADVFEKEISPKISQITDRYLGRGQKVNQCSREQTEALDLIVTDMKDLMATI